MILSYVLIQDEYCLMCSFRMNIMRFPVLLGSFDKRERRHYIQAVNRYHENPSMLYTMIKSYCCEKNCKIS